LAGVGVGQLLPFMLADEERARLVSADALQHDPYCGIYAVRSFRELSDQEIAVQEQLLGALRGALAERAADPSAQ